MKKDKEDNFEKIRYEEDLFEEENHEEEYFGLINCDYCRESYMSDSGDIFGCEDPDIEFIHENCPPVELNNICDDCCNERIYEGLCYPLNCSVFKKKYPQIRISKITKILENNKISFIIRDNNSIIPKDNPIWGYFFKELPSRFSPQEEISEKSLILIFDQGSKTKLMIRSENRDFYVDIEIIDLFKHYSNDFKISKYFICTKEFEKDGEKQKGKILILKYSCPVGNLPPEYLVVIMRDFMIRSYNKSEFIYDRHQIRIRYYYVNKLNDDSRLMKLKLYFAQVDLRRNHYIIEKGIFKLESRDRIRNQIKENLRNAKLKDANMIIFPEYCFPEECLQELIQFSKNEKIWIIGGIERINNKDYNLDLFKNAAIIISPDFKPIIQLKNFIGRDEPPFISGKELLIIESNFGVFSVLVCADFLEDSLLLKIKESVDFIIVISFNKDINEFNTRAYSKCLANYCYIIITNIKRYEGYSIHAPFRNNKRKINMLEFPYHELDLNEFSKYRRRIEKSINYKKPLSDTLYDYKFHF